MVFQFLRRKKGLSHEEARELLSSYADQELEAKQVAKLEAHLQECTSCRNELEAIRITQRLVHSLPSIGLPRSFTLEVAPRVAPMPRSFIYLRGATGLAAAAFVALLAIRAVLPMAGVPLGGGLQTEDTAVELFTAAADPQPKPAAAEAVGSAEMPTTADVQVQTRGAPQPAPTTVAAAPAAPMRAVAPTAVEEAVPAPTAAAEAASAPPPAEVTPAAAPAEDVSKAAPKAQAPEPTAAPAGQAVPPAPPPETAVSDQANQADPSQYGLGAGEGGQQGEGTAGQAEIADATLAGLPAQHQPIEAGAESFAGQTEAVGFAVFLTQILAVTAILVVVLAAATSAIWWRHRRPFQ
ncbi:MAG: zf-HC2 domain-containing protein [Chloroflexota bacterium]